MLLITFALGVPIWGLIKKCFCGSDPSTPDGVQNEDQTENPVDIYPPTTGTCQCTIPSVDPPMTLV